MTNGDTPATSCTVVEQTQNAMGSGSKKITHKGLTKREAFAMAAMQGLIANHTLRGPHEECAELALCYADALLKELEK